MSNIRSNAALTLAAVSLFVALASGAYAVSIAKKNSVTSKSVKNASITGVDIKDESLGGGDIKDESLGGGDINEATLSLPPDQVGAPAYARVLPAGAVDPAFTKNIAIQAKGTGTYCLDVTTASPPQNITASVDAATSDGRKQWVTVSIDAIFIHNTGCPAGTDALAIGTFWQPGGVVATVADVGFYVSIND